jgi:hypothetical protein
MDLQSGYWQLQTAPEDHHRTAFITKYGLFEYTFHLYIQHILSKQPRP